MAVSLTLSLPCNGSKFAFTRIESRALQTLAIKYGSVLVSFYIIQRLRQAVQMVKNVLLNVLPQTQAYVSSDAGTMNQLRAVDDGAIKIPYRIFVGGIAFNVSKALFLIIQWS